NSDKLGQPSTVIIDPPRAGMHDNVVQGVLKLQPQRIVYVSCNPATFARDAKSLCQVEYELMKVQPVDMFPMTPHIELVSLLKRVED
ncbi:23S rRNA (uracil(1939)-C(5))-methyltransferase RlmD, partial [candidate division KSB1 bacterium]|nr:23S rRNA (uracil(1939)-C(5))-methyltransferase RlmD [candidate division KSB1 bacterium]